VKIQSNITFLSAQRRLDQTSRAIARSLERLASGSRLNRAADDAVGVGLSEGLRSQIRASQQNIRNINDAYGMIRTAEGSIRIQVDLIQRMRELALQAANGTLGLQDRQKLNQEMQELVQELSRLTETTNFNGRSLLNGSETDFSIQVGSQKGETIDISLPDVRANSLFERTRIDDSIGRLRVTDVEGNPASALISVSNRFGDFNGDGITDMIAGGSNSINVYLGNDELGFDYHTNFSTGGAGFFSNPEIADMDGDGILDVVTPVNNTNNITIHFGDGEGNFGDRVTLNTDISGSQGVRLDDIDGDGDVDIIVTDSAATAFKIFENDGTGAFSISQTYALPSNPNGTTPTVADVTGDGLKDLLVATSTGFTVFEGDGAGGFVEAGSFGASSFSGLRSVDIDGDGDLDIFAKRSSNSSFYIYLNDGNGDFSYANEVFSSNSFSVADVNGDNILDFVGIANSGTDQGGMYLGDGDGTFTLTQTITGPATNSFKESFFDDVNNDGFQDAVFFTSVEGEAWIYLGDGTGAFTHSQTLAFRDDLAGTNAHRITQIDLDGDGRNEYVAQHISGSTSTIQILSHDISEEDYLPDLEILSQEQAQDLLEVLDQGLQRLTDALASLGATENRLISAESSLLNLQQNLVEARSRLQDTDLAEETAELVRAQILQQAATAVLGQASFGVRVVLALLTTRGA
jgi:flagellin